ncbi:MgtC/SapB family protein [soil metagenome]
MNEQEIFSRLGMALAIGLLIGVERGWRERALAEGTRAAGLRTFALIGLSGGVWGGLVPVTGPIPLSAAFIATAAAVILFRWREAGRENEYGVTTVVAALLTFGLGAYAALGDMSAAAAAAVATTVLLATKRWLHGWVQALTWEELRASLILLVMSFIALPLLPDRAFGPYDALNPRSLWLMAIAIAGVSFIGYLAVKSIGARYGSLVAGVAGGLVSSTAATLDFARKARARTDLLRVDVAGACAASSVMFLRILTVGASFGAALVPPLAPPLIAAAAVLVAAAIGFGATWQPSTDDTDNKSFRNPFELWTVIRFAVLLAFILLASKWLTTVFGGGGAIVTAAAAGLADVDAITLSILQLGAAVVSQADAKLAILVAASANSLAKCGIAWFVGGPRFGVPYTAVTLGALGAAGAALAVQAWLA